MMLGNFLGFSLAIQAFEDLVRELLVLIKTFISRSLLKLLIDYIFKAQKLKLTFEAHASLLACILFIELLSTFN